MTMAMFKVIDGRRKERKPAEWYGKKYLQQVAKHLECYQESGDSKNMPTQKGMERKYFEVKESTINNPDGSIRVTKTTKVTGKGQVYFVNKFLAEKAS